MTIKMINTASVAGAYRAIGEILTLDLVTESALVAAGNAVVLNQKTSFMANDIYNTFIYNYSPDKYKTLRAKLNNTAINVSNTVGCFLGDSTTVGSPGSVTAMKPNSYVTRLATLLSNAGLSAGSQNWMGSAGADYIASSLPVLDPRVALGANWVIFVLNGIGGSIYRNATNTNPITFTPTTQTDTVDIYYYDGTGYDNFTIKTGADGTVACSSGGSVTITGTNTIKKATAVAPSLISNVWTVQKNTANAANCAIQGMNAYNNTVKSVQLLNCGVNSQKMSYFTLTTNTWFANVFLTTAGTLPDFVVLDLGINDWLQSTSLSGFQLNLSTLVQQMQAQDTPVIIASPIPTKESTVSLNTQQNYVDCMASVSSTFNIAMIDNWSRWKSQELLGTTFYGDNNIHPNAVGYQDKAKAAASLMLRI